MVLLLFNWRFKPHIWFRLFSWWFGAVFQICNLLFKKLKFCHPSLFLFSLLFFSLGVLSSLCQGLVFVYYFFKLLRLIWWLNWLSAIVVLIVLELLLPHHFLLLYFLPVLLFSWSEVVQVLVHFIWVAIKHFIESFCRHLLVLCVNLRLFVFELLNIFISILRPLLSFSQKEIWSLNLVGVVTSYRWGHLWLLLLEDPLFITPVTL
jgi:hypothetical protein